ncbi:LysR family transcriptional regulator [Pseudorhodoferax sp.]|uniref:LysR family transcriptional regulator n=1 Tax=Pseudorhodoferax sp. TaxID=1993553 RepID=UPI0039E4FDB8
MQRHRFERKGGTGRIDLNLLPTLQAILEEGNLSRAAVALGVSQPAISQSLSKLREHFGDELFVRSGKVLLPTPRALALQPMVARLLREAEMLSRPPQGFDPRTADVEFIVCLSEFVEFMMLPQLAAEFARHAPQCRIRGMRVQHSQLQALLEQGDVDLVIGAVAGAAPSLRQQRLAEHRLVCVVSAQGQWARRAPTLQDYTEGRHVAVHRTADNVDIISERLTLKGIRRNTVVSVSSDFVAARTVAQTDALCTLPLSSGQPLTKLFPLRLHPLPFDAGVFTARMIWHERFQSDASHIWLRKLVEKAYKGWVQEAQA